MDGRKPPEVVDTRQLWNTNAPAWTELARAGYDVYRDLVNSPGFFAVLPAVNGQLGLDVGCGEGHNTRHLAALGAEVVALDISELFIAAASAEARPGVRFVLGDGARLPLTDRSFEFVTAFMSLMDVSDPETTLHEIARVLKPGGFVQFSVVHPTTSTPIRHWIEDDSGQRQALAVGDYFYEGPLTESWIFGAAPKEVRDRHAPFMITYARRTLTGWIDAVLDAQLTLEAISEPHADEDTARAHPEVADTQIAPYFLILRARKPAEEANRPLTPGPTAPHRPIG
jgi:SAM-dependent methyltransferase